MVEQGHWNLLAKELDESTMVLLATGCRRLFTSRGTTDPSEHCWRLKPQDLSKCKSSTDVLRTSFSI